jgi:hypothetical protein
MKVWGSQVDVVKTIQRYPLPPPDFDLKNLSTAKSWGSSMIEWLDRNEKLCATAIKDDQNAKFVRSETMTRTANDPNKHARNADLVPLHHDGKGAQRDSTP